MVHRAAGRYATVILGALSCRVVVSNVPTHSIHHPAHHPVPPRGRAEKPEADEVSEEDEMGASAARPYHGGACQPRIQTRRVHSMRYVISNPGAVSPHDVMTEKHTTRVPRPAASAREEVPECNLTQTTCTGRVASKIGPPRFCFTTRHTTRYPPGVVPRSRRRTRCRKKMRWVRLQRGRTMVARVNHVSRRVVFTQCVT